MSDVKSDSNWPFNIKWVISFFRSDYKGLDTIFFKFPCTLDQLLNVRPLVLIISNTNTPTNINTIATATFHNLVSNIFDAMF